MKNLNNAQYVLDTIKTCEALPFFINNADFSNYAFIEQIIKNNPKSFKYLPQTVKNNFKLSLLCSKLYAPAVAYVSENLINDYKWATQAIMLNAQTFRYICARNKAICSNKDLCILASKHVDNLIHINDKLFEDFEFLCKLVEQNPYNISYICKKAIDLSVNKIYKPCLLAIAQTEQVFSLLPIKIQSDKTFVQQAIDVNINVVKMLR